MAKKTQRKKSPHAHKVAKGKNRIPVLMDILQRGLSDAELIKEWGFASGGPIRCYREGEVAKQDVIALRQKLGKKAAKPLIRAAKLAAELLAAKEAKKAARKAKTAKKKKVKTAKPAKKAKAKTSDRLSKAVAKKAAAKKAKVTVKVKTSEKLVKSRKAAPAPAPKAEAAAAPKAEAAPKAKLTVTAGQTFRDKDTRRNGRTVKVVSVEGDKALIDSNGKQSKVALARLSSKFELVTA